MDASGRRGEELTWEPVGDSSCLLSARQGPVALVRIDRPASRNALSNQLMTDLIENLEWIDLEPDVRVIIIWGGERVFAAGADIAEMTGATPLEMHQRPRHQQWQRLRRVRKPMVAAVNGYALGGGNELAMVCDIIIAGESAVFGQPEVGLGLIPGGGGAQRLVRAVGKARAMDVILTGRTLPAREALAAGLVSRVVPDELCLAEAIEVGRAIAEHPRHAVQMAKDAVLHAFDLPLESGLDYERRLFELLFASADTQERLAAFVQKRKPLFKGE